MRPLLVASPSAKAGGAERALFSLIRALPAAGWQPHVVLLEDGPLAGWLRDAGTEAQVLDAGRTRQLHRTGATIATLRRAARASGAEAVLSSMSKGHVYGGVAAAAARLPALWWQHGIPRASRIETAAALVPAAAIACVSKLATDAQRRLTPHRNVVTIHPGLPIEQIAARRGSGAAIRRRLGWEDALVVGIVGRLQPWKGQDVFLRGAALAARSRPDFRLLVVGGAILGWEGDYPLSLRRLAAELGLGDRVYFAGHQDDALAWTDAADILVHSSTEEPFGLVLIEALALGKPLVATAGGGPDEIIVDGESGLLVRSGDPLALAAALDRLAHDDALRSRLAAAGAPRAALFSEARTAAAFARLLGKVTGPRPAA